MTLLIALLVIPPCLWLADRIFNRGELFALIREEFGMAPVARRPRGVKRVRITVRR